MVITDPRRAAAGADAVVEVVERRAEIERGRVDAGVTVSLSEVLAALSYALDLTEGAPSGHSVRTCLIGMRFAAELGLGADDRSALYYALLLKDAGCSSNAHGIAELYGSDERTVKREYKFADWSNSGEGTAASLRFAGAGQPLSRRARQLWHLAKYGPGQGKGFYRERCERGAGIARRLGFPESAAAAIRALDEHWDGRGLPDGLAGEAIPLLARIAGIAQTVELFFWRFGLDRALDIARRRRGTWFDPRLADMLLGWRGDEQWWSGLLTDGVASLVVGAEPDDRIRGTDETGLDLVCQAFADIVDAKSPYTYHHSTSVARYAVGVAEALGWDGGAIRRIRRAGWLHDIGKLGVSNRILDKPAKLTPEERAVVERHPVFTWEILAQVTAFRDFAWTAAVHHERIDGRGYPWKLGADRLGTGARILAVADVYDALTADRPYRAGMPAEKALAILRRDAGAHFDPDVVAALERSLAG